jgi:hypothetical protein
MLSLFVVVGNLDYMYKLNLIDLYSSRWNKIELIEKYMKM